MHQSGREGREEEVTLAFPRCRRLAAVLIWARLLFEMTKLRQAGDRSGDYIALRKWLQLQSTDKHKIHHIYCQNSMSKNDE